MVLARRVLAWALGLCVLLALPSMAIAEESDPLAPLVATVTVQARQAGVGWLAPVDDGGSGGGSGSGHGMTDLKLALDEAPDFEGTLVYQVADPDGNWTLEHQGGDSASAGSKGIGGLKAHLEGPIADHYDLTYRVSFPAVGWLGWARNGDEAGAFGLGKPIESVQVQLIPKGSALPAAAMSQPLIGPASLSFSGYVSGLGDTGTVPAGGTFGVAGRALHDFQISLAGERRPAGSVSYRVNTGSWRPWVSGGSACPVDPDAPIQALEVRLDGTLAACYDVWYRAHPIGMGWLGWASNGATAGTGNLNTHLDQVQVTLLPKGSPAPGSTQSPYVSRVPMGTVLGNVANAPGGLSAFGGASFDPASPEGQRLQVAINAVSAGGKQLGFAMVDIESGRGLAYNADQAIYVASSLKGPYVAAVNKFHPDQVGPSVRATMEECISISCNDCYANLRNTFGPQTMADMQAYVGGCSFTPYLNYPWVSAKDLAKLWVGCHEYFFRDMNQNSEWCRNLYTSSYNSFIRDAVGWKATTYTKAGWIAYDSTYLARNDAGIVMDGDHPYVLAILSTAYGRDEALIELTNAIDAIHTSIVPW